MAAVAALPGLSQLMAWPTEHLTDAAEHWEAVAERSYGVVSQIWQDASSADWQGDAADALRTATHSDMLATSTATDQLQSAARVARSGAADLYAARSRLLYAIEDALTAGFEVDEEGSLVDGYTGGSAAQRAARQSEAQILAADIGRRAAQLVATDQQVAGKVTAALSGIRDVFAPGTTTAGPPVPTPSRNPGARAVDSHTVKQDGVPRDANAGPPWGQRPPPKTLEEVRDALQQLQRGRNPPVREVPTPEELKDFWDWLSSGAKDLPPRGDTARKVLDDGTEIDLRPNSSSGGPTIEVVTPGSGKNPKVHLPLPFVDDPPRFAPGFDHPPTAPATPAPGHPLPGPVGPAQFFDPAEVPPWLKDPSPPGFAISPAQQPPVFDWDTPGSAPPPATHTAPSSSGDHAWLPDIGHDLSEGGKAVFGWVVVGGVLVWTLLSGAGQTGEAALP